MDGAFAAESPDGVPGNALIYDHVHLTVAGHYLVAHALFRFVGAKGWVERALPSVRAAEGELSQAECLRRLGWTEHVRGP